ncbi:MAG: serine--tRNA ligase [Alphaproteobacteria bacterium]|nr:serine--tRNA ligase [Alphaproteobacteria bacterium]MCB9792811.1 serine--tRNA ligase [Alphaproteobacteria bacterium]
MLDARLVEDQPELIRAALLKRHAGEDTLAALDRVAEINQKRRELVAEVNDARALRNELSPQIGRMMKAGQREEAEGLKERVRVASERAKELEVEVNELEAERQGILMGIPNLLDPRVPEGKGEEENVEVRRWGAPPEMDFEPKAHDELGVALGLMDFEAAARISGARFSVLKGAVARLERALISFFLDMHTREHGYEEVMVPYIVRDVAMEGTGQLPKFGADMFRLAEPVNGSEAYLIPTAEVPVTNLYRGEILDGADLPLAYAAFTPCFRAEAGAYGRDTRGLIRQHQFHKVELVRITAEDDSDAQHEALTSHAEACLQALGLHYRVVRLCSGDISANARHCYDLEVWLPAQQTFREISSCSTFGDFQARRMDLRYRPVTEGGKKAKPRFCHTINGSGLAVGRALVAILENYQQADGSVVIPEVLRGYMGGLDRIEAPR